MARPNPWTKNGKPWIDDPTIWKAYCEYVKADHESLYTSQILWKHEDQFRINYAMFRAGFMAGGSN